MSVAETPAAMLGEQFPDNSLPALLASRWKSCPCQSSAQTPLMKRAMPDTDTLRLPPWKRRQVLRKRELIEAVQACLGTSVSHAGTLESNGTEKGYKQGTTLAFAAAATVGEPAAVEVASAEAGPIESEGELTDMGLACTSFRRNQYRNRESQACHIAHMEGLV